MDELAELRDKLKTALHVAGETDDSLLGRYDAAQTHALGQKIRNRANREILPYKPEFRDAVWQGLHRGADIIDPDGDVESDGTGWFADNHGNGDENFPWYPSLQLPGVCLRLPIGHPTKESCEQFIEQHVLGQPVLDDDQEGR